LIEHRGTFTHNHIGARRCERAGTGREDVEVISPLSFKHVEVKISE
jgi:hypothetical protein